MSALALGILIGVRPELGLGATAAGILLGLFLIDLTTGVVAFYVMQMALHVFPSLAVGVKVLGAVLLLAWIVEVLPIGVQTRPRASLMRSEPVIAAGLATYMAYGAVSILWTPSTASTLDAIVRFSFNVILVVTVFAAAQTKTALRAILRGLTLGGAATVVLLVASGAHISGSRLGSESTDANTLALALAPGVLIGCGLVVVETRTRWRALAGIAAIANLLGLFLTDSRGGLVTLGVGLVTWFLFGGQWRYGVAALCCTVVAGTGIYFSVVAGNSARERMLAAIGKSHDPSLQSSGRTDIWKVGLRAVKAEPLTGGGFGAYTSIAPKYLLTEPGLIRRSDFLIARPKVAHNLYLHELVEVGILGFFPLVVTMLVSLKRYRRAIVRFRLRGSRDLELLARVVFASTIGVLAGEFFLSGQYAKILWVLVALGPVFVNLDRTDSALR